MSHDFTDAELRAAFARATHEGATARTPECPSPDALLAAISGVGPEAARLRTLDHALRCPACRPALALLSSVADAAANAPAPDRGAERAPAVVGRIAPWWRRAPALAAASLVLAAGLAGVVRSRQRGTDEVVREGAGGELALVTPADGGSVRAALPATFVWRTVAGARRYTLELSATDGTVVYTAQTPDTALVVPALRSVAPGEYRWSVRAERDDGSVGRSTARRVVVR